jgi:Cu-Zn family superoxide dismutase
MYRSMTTYLAISVGLMAPSCSSSPSESPRADAGSGGGGGEPTVSSVGPWTVYDDPYGNGQANPAAGIMGTAIASGSASSGMHLELVVLGLPADRTFGSHLHVLACDDMKAGGHYENTLGPADAGTNNPLYANAANEAWLDFITDMKGAGVAKTDVPWFPRSGGARAIIVHDHGTAPGGVAGAKLACLGISF